jgi:hypothetical protein
MEIKGAALCPLRLRQILSTKGESDGLSSHNKSMLYTLNGQELYISITYYSNTQQFLP